MNTRDNIGWWFCTIVGNPNQTTNSEKPKEETPPAKDTPKEPGAFTSWLEDKLFRIKFAIWVWWITLKLPYGDRCRFCDQVKLLRFTKPLYDGAAGETEIENLQYAYCCEQCCPDACRKQKDWEKQIKEAMEET